MLLQTWVPNLVHIGCMVLTGECIKDVQNARHCQPYLIPNLHNLCENGKNAYIFLCKIIISNHIIVCS